MTGLQEHGISFLRNALPNEIRDSSKLLSLPAPLSIETAGDLSYDSGTPRDVLERGEAYYNRNIAELLQLRTQAAAPNSRDISLREAHIMLGLSENLFCSSARLRMALGAAMKDFRILQVSLSLSISISISIDIAILVVSYVVWSVALDC